MRRMRLSVVLLVVIAIGVVAYSLTETRGIGSFDQKVILKSSKPIKTLSYCNSDVDAEHRLLAESTADPRLFDWKVVKPVGEWFTAKIWTGSRSRPFAKTQVWYYRQLVILVEFTDGASACRVVDLPNGNPRPPITIEFD